MIRSRSYSRVSRSWMISRCRRPRKPQRKPKPNAADVSISKLKLASLSRSLDRLSRNFSKSLASVGKRPQNTTGWTSLNPGSACAVGRFASVIVSPTRVSATSLIWAVMKPISPAPKLRQLLDLGPEHADPVDQVRGAGGHEADLLALADHAVDHADQDDDAEIGVVPAVDQHRLQGRRRIARGRRDPRDDRLQHFVDADAGLGAGQHRPPSCQSPPAGRPTMSSISLRTLSTSAAGRSILLITGTISWSCSIDW